ncbi:MAG: molybdopterin molybdotransferase MoeA [Rhodospirillales bacterium]|nr:molybdopterin molybdotransferase MoeA [Rhodospirillales bacterium]
MISLEEALDRVIGGVDILPAEVVSITDALGRVLSEDVTSRVTQPPAAVSSMDGYAVKAADVTSCPATLKLVGESAAGGGFDGTLGQGESVRIFTGAPVPAGADAVIMQENTGKGDGEVKILEGVEVGNFIRPAGMDFNHGDVLLPKGRVMSARDIGLAAAMNVPWLKVIRRPRIAILATGNEVVMPGDPVGPAQILSSNSLSLSAMVKAFGGEVINVGIAQDDENSLHMMVEGAQGADLLVTIGGASVGDYDLVQQVLGKEGLELGFYKVAMKPGKPLIFGTVKGTPVLGLPGNPVSANVTALIFLRAAMETMLGLPAHDIVTGTALLGVDVPKNGPRKEFMRATTTKREDGEVIANPYEEQDSSLLARLAAADCLVIRDPNAEPAKAGERVKIVTLTHSLISA